MNLLERRGLGDVATALVDDTPVGELGLVATPRGLRVVIYGGRGTVDRADALRGRGTPDKAMTHLDRAVSELEAYFRGNLRRFRVKRDLGDVTEFQEEVLKELKRIPYGSVTTYGEIAASVGNPGAATAVGSVVGANALPIFVPCHRVVRSDGTLGDYVGGAPRKMADRKSVV